MKRVRRVDVAKAAGVSQATVSYVLRNTPGASISQKTRERVLRVAKELGYGLNFVASSLARGKTDIIGLLLPSQEYQFHAYYSEMIAGLVSEANDTPYYFLYLGQDHVEKYLNCVARQYLDGLIVIQSRDDDTHLQAVQRFKGPIVTVNYLNGYGYPSVSMDYEKVVDVAYGYMSSRRRRNVVFVCADKNMQPNRRHIARFHELKKDYKGTLETETIDFEKFVAFGRQVEDILDVSDWDGLVVDGVGNALRLADALGRRGKVLGSDFDLSMFTAEHVHVSIPPRAQLLEAQGEAMGRHGWRMMATLLQGKVPAQSTILLPFLERSGS